MAGVGAGAVGQATLRDGPLELDGASLSLADVVAVGRGEREVRLAPAAGAAMDTTPRMVDEVVARGETVYGVTTGFGELARTRIAPEQAHQLQLNLVRSHAAGDIRSGEDSYS